MNSYALIHRGSMVNPSAVALGLLVAMSSCSEDDLVDDIFTPQQWTKVQELSPLPDPPSDSTNRYEDDPQDQ